MTEAFKVLAQGTVTTSTTALYTVPGSTEAIIKCIIFCNYSAAAKTLSVFVGGSADVNRIINDLNLGIDYRHEFNGSMALEAASTIQAIASANTSISYTILGVEIS